VSERWSGKRTEDERYWLPLQVAQAHSLALSVEDGEVEFWGLDADVRGKLVASQHQVT